MQIEGFFKDKKGNLKATKHSCASCGLYKNSECYKIPPYGSFNQRIINIGEAPGQAECRDNKPWVGKVGQYLQRTLEKFDINLFDDCVNWNSVNCFVAPKNRTPTEKQIACCREMVVRPALQQYGDKADLIMLYGGSALKSFLKHRFPGTLYGINRWRGWAIPDQDYNAWVCPVFHPSYVVRSDKEIENIWLRDLEKALNTLDKPVPKFKEPEIEYIEDLTKLYDITSDITTFDYETTGLKPQGKGHRIVCCAISDTPDHAYAFFMPEKRKDWKPFLWYLQNKDIGKIAANDPFEDNWSEVRALTEVRGWIFDTMIAAHVLDNRAYVAGLKFQTYVNFGIIDYSSSVDPYIHHKGHGNDLNRIMELMKTEQGRAELIKYVGWDSVLEHRLAKIQMEQMDYDFLPFL